MTLPATVVWIVGVVVLPVLGSLVWFLVGRRDLRRRPSTLRG
ncbi:PLDc N-terminal domain-containing protein [Curtobacterium sp. CFBP9011]|nr:PLDc N-terminal domain-containing protein [Curtobacterium sp. CFBP9011]MDY1005068.1 PLDc N-terminal domain-containing protein [Curtobacterium sp. CFBP9011]